MLRHFGTEMTLDLCYLYISFMPLYILYICAEMVIILGAMVIILGSTPKTYFLKNLLPRFVCKNVFCTFVELLGIAGSRDPAIRGCRLSSSPFYF